MTNQTFPISLLHIPTDKPVDAELLCTIGKEQIADWEKFWIPAKKEGLKASQESQLHKSIPGSRHWNWDKKANHANSFLACSGYSIVCEGRTEGLMVITKSIHSARLESQKGKPLIYVDYIETAPWNIKGFMPPGKYSGIGSIFLNTAIQVSVHEGY
ncbi:MAG TPA: GNAT family N-acetyltransferase [Desulfovibrio sp.]|nr:GNAT family N-acetyltransferase [Desulfovibrio sp.]